MGISLIEVVSAGGNTARMHEVDLLGGTPPPDIKPYVRRFDHRDDARSGWADA
ncbi:MAG: TrmO family methyltransferase [Methanoculleus sp.]